MNDYMWSIHLDNIQKNISRWLRDDLYKRLKEGGKSADAYGFDQVVDIKFLTVQAHIDDMCGEPEAIIEKVGKMGHITDDDEKQERQLLELNLEFIQAAHDSDVEYGKELHAAGADVNFLHPLRRMGALHYAASRSRNFVRFLVNTGECDYLLKDKEGRIPFDLAARFSGDTAVIKLLVKKANLQSKVEGYKDLQDFIDSTYQPKDA